MKDFSKDKQRPNEPIIEDLKKEDLKGKRNPKKKDKDYEKKYGRDVDNWN
jgi:hypothetical protein